MATVYPLTIFYDASCKLCNTEMESVRALDQKHRLVLVDCSSADFDERPYTEVGISQQDMLNCMHIRDSQGNWYRGVDAFEHIYNAIGLRKIAKLWAHPLTRPLTERAYPWVVKNRHVLSHLGLPMVLKLWGRFAAYRAFNRSKACAKGACRAD